MLRVDLARLQREGKLRINGELEGAAEFFDEGSAYRFEGTPTVDLHVSFAGSGEVIVRGRVEGTMVGECRRCLRPVPHELDKDVTLVFAPADDLEEDDGEMRVIDPSDTDIELVPVLREELILSVPQYAECRTDCRGLCPRCGVDLNEEDCDCDDSEPDARWDALRALQNE